MNREPMTALDTTHDALVQEQLEEAWLDIEHALDAAEIADARATATTTPATPPPFVAFAPAAASSLAPRVRCWPSRLLATAMLLALVAVAFHFFAGGR
jgi:hypothetical protein